MTIEVILQKVIRLSKMNIKIKSALQFVWGWIWAIIVILFFITWIATEAWYETSIRDDVRELKEKVIALEKEKV